MRECITHHMCDCTAEKMKWLEERVEKLEHIKESAKDWLDDTEEGAGHFPEWKALADALAQDAVHSEREACAKVADTIAGNDKDFDRYVRKAAGMVALAIRERK